MINAKNGKVKLKEKNAIILSDFVCIVRALRESKIPDEEIKKAFDYGFMSEDEINKLVLEKITRMIGKMHEIIEIHEKEKNEQNESEDE